MLDIKYVREHLEEVIERLNTRNGDYSYLREIPVLDEKRRALIKEGDELKAKRNSDSKLIGTYKKEGKDTTELMAGIQKIKDRIPAIDTELEKIDNQIREMLLKTPNLPDKSLPIGKDDTFNTEVRRWGEPRKFDFEPLSHWDLGTKLGYFDFERGVKVAGPRFTFYKGAFAKLERSIMMLMLDTHTLESGYTEILPPYLVNTASMYGTGQLPKFAEDAYNIKDSDLWLISTAEIPVTNYFRDEILSADQLPTKFCAYSSCFRGEAGSAGRDTRGIIRQHQFQKVELVKFVKPEDSWDALESLTRDAEKILQKLELPYHVVTLSTGDVGFSSAKTYDIEVWIPSMGIYKEVSSVSDANDYQARRNNTRFRDKETGKTRFVHTLNGSGLATSRVFPALIEQMQLPDGSIRIPDVLVPFMGGQTKLERR